MALQDNTQLTLLELAKQLDPDGTIADVAYLLNQTNRILDDAVFVEANEITTHQVSVETGLPEVYWRSFNQGVVPSVGHTAQVKEPMGIMEARSRVDIDLAMLNGNTDAYRLNESRRFLEAMNQEWSESVWYSDPLVNKNKPMGLTMRYSDPTAGNGGNILNGGGSGSDNTSIWLLVHSDQTVFFPFPKGSKAGLVHENLGRYTAQNVGGVQGAEMEVFGDRFQFKTGVALKDWRYVVRICNVDVSDLLSLSSTQATTASTQVIRLMIQALDRVPSLEMGTPVFYCNRKVRSGLAIQAMEKSTSALSLSAGARQFSLDFLGVPIKTSDSLLSTEDLVTGF